MTVPLRAYLHCTMINNYLEIVDKILNTMSESGFLADCVDVSVGALGEEGRLEPLKYLISKYPKVYLRGWDERKDLWEGFTMQWLREDAENLPKFFGLYTHTKVIRK